MKSPGPCAVAACLLVGLPLMACKSGEERRPGRRTVVQLIPVGGEAPADPRATITEADVRHELAHVRLERSSSLNAPPLEPELKQALIERMIDQRLLAMEASVNGVRVSSSAVDREVAAIRRSAPDYQRQLIQTYQTEGDLRQVIEERLVAARVVQKEALSRVKVSDAEVQKVWDAMPANEKIRPARVHAAQIVLRTEEEGRAVIAALKKKNADFAEIARQRSVSPEREKGGDLGWFEAGVMPTVFDEVCFSLSPGQISELTPSEYGFHIFKLIAAEPEHPLTFEDARPQLVERLREEATRKAENEYLASLRAKVRIVKNDELIAQLE